MNNNKIFVDSKKSFLENNSVITFKGKGNILFVENGVRLSNSRIDFNGDNALVYLSASRFCYYLGISANYASCIFVGKNNYINGRLNLITSERKNIIIGGEGLISFGIFIRTADPHLIYSCETKHRINPSRSVIMGDHVWIGQNAMLLKGSVIGSGSIIGGGGVLSNKVIPSNVSAVGNPAKIIAQNIFFKNECVHNWTSEQTESFQVVNTDEWIYKKDDSNVDIYALDSMICEKSSAEDKLDVVLEYIVKNTSKNRFFIEDKSLSSTNRRFSFFRSKKH